jgi:hypothetical protein
LGGAGVAAGAAGADVAASGFGAVEACFDAGAFLRRGDDGMA